MPAAETNQFLWRRFKTFNRSFPALNVPLSLFCSSQQTAKMADRFLLNWVVGWEGRREDNRNLLEELIPQVSVVFTGAYS